jgi:hypothetical protein
MMVFEVISLAESDKQMQDAEKQRKEAKRAGNRP